MNEKTDNNKYLKLIFKNGFDNLNFVWDAGLPKTFSHKA